MKHMQESPFTTRVQDAGRDAADTIREARCQQGMSSALVPPCVGLLFAEKQRQNFWPGFKMTCKSAHLLKESVQICTS